MTALSLAPIGHHWPRERVIGFYREVADMPVEVVYLGEAVCNKRASMRLKDWATVAASLMAAGKKVVLAAKPVVESAAELRLLERLAALGARLEVNDAGLMSRLAADSGFVAGPHLNAFNAGAVRALQRCGARRWVAPFEMDRASFALVLADLVPQMESEVLAYGRLPLAFSTHCYTARSYGRSRHDCLQCCLEHPEGQRLETLDGREIMVVNGPQTLSQPVYNLMGGVSELTRMGVTLLRLDPPNANEAGAVVRLFDAVLRGALSEGDALRALAPLSPASFCNGYWLGLAGAAYVAPHPSGGFPLSRPSPAYSRVAPFAAPARSPRS